jgi:hypothetical protein
MADTVTLIFPWPLFQGIKDGQPLVGGKLYTYAAETSTPKASYGDPFFVTPNVNPVVLDDQGAATVWLDGYYHLRLTDAEDVLLWDVPSYTFAGGTPPAPGDLIMGSTEATLQPTPGAAVLTFGNAAPAGYRVLGTTWSIITSFGGSQGVGSILVGDAHVIDRWANITDLTAGQSGGQAGFHGGDEPISPTAYSVLVTAVSGAFDGVGEIHITCFWSSLPADVP